MAHNTVEAFETVRRLNHGVKLDESPPTALSRDELQKQDFAKPVSFCVSKILGPNSRFRIAQNMPQISRASRASRSNITFGPYACSAMVCVRHKDSTLREKHRGVELCVQINPTLSLQRISSTVQLFCLGLETNYCASTKKQSFPRLESQVFLRSLQYGIVVMGVIDAFVYTHIQHHRRNVDNPGNFGDCMKGRNHSDLCPRVSIALPDGTYSRCSTFQISSTCSQNQISAPPIFEKAMIFRVGTSALTGVLALLTVKPWPDGMLSHDLPWENGCHVWPSCHD